MAANLFLEIFLSPSIFTIVIAAVIATIGVGYLIVWYMKSLRRL
jgi:hypothetical protein